MSHRSHVLFNEEEHMHVLVPGPPEARGPSDSPPHLSVGGQLETYGEVSRRTQNSPSVSSSHGSDACVPTPCGAKLEQVSDRASVPVETWAATWSSGISLHDHWVTVTSGNHSVWLASEYQGSHLLGCLQVPFPPALSDASLLCKQPLTAVHSLGGCASRGC